ncbi:MAG: bifunctional indole-3-glycerol-phosphate synthase TrpC/phosphoribosylanthranilate isomerase TrpF [Pyrinomonadaceae bacterium]
MNPSPNFLAEIIARKRQRLGAMRAAHPSETIATLRARSVAARRISEPHALRRALAAGKGVAVIAEIKRASPSKGVIREGLEPAELARAYYRGGAVAISVLTEEDYFLGSLDDLRAVREAVSLPILRKDFIFDEYQVYETAAAGADALLLIVAALDDDRLSALRHIAEDELGMDALVEVHTAEEMRRAVRCGATIIGVNNRNLTTFEVSLGVSVELAPEAPAEALLVSESGLRSIDDLRRLQAHGYRAFLIGETLMRSDNPAKALRTLIEDVSSEVRVKVCGITNLPDALTCLTAGADMLGFNFYSGSPRYVEPDAARRIIEQLPTDTHCVGIFVNEENAENVGRTADLTGITAVQLHGDETPGYCRALKDRFVIKALRVGKNFTPEQAAQYDADAVLLDTFSSKTHGGTGQQFDWSIARETGRFVPKLFLAGGLTPENVAAAVSVVRPFGVDVCSSLESGPGKKNEERVRAFIAAVKEVA